MSIKFGEIDTSQILQNEYRIRVLEKIVQGVLKFSPNLINLISSTMLKINQFNADEYLILFVQLRFVQLFSTFFHKWSGKTKSKHSRLCPSGAEPLYRAEDDPGQRPADATTARRWGER